MLKILLIAVLLLAAGLAGALLLFLLQVRGELKDGRYFTRTAAQRRAVRSRTERQARLLAPLFAAAARRVEMPLTEYRGLRVPPVCTPASMAAAAAYRPDQRDVFVVTQIKSGTTWMQQLTYEVLCGGHGDLGDDGHRHLQAVAPHFETASAVPLERVPRLGPAGRRLIKTHLPASLCPYSPRARYVYVARNPWSCMVSAREFVSLLTGPFAMAPEAFTDWFCSDDMWWGPWPDHVDGWWRRAAAGNVLFLHYEQMLDDRRGVIRRVAQFLDVDLDDAALARIEAKTSREYMRAHEHLFEMSPPTPFTRTAHGGFVTGVQDRAAQLEEDERRRIACFCRERLREDGYPLADFYPEVASLGLPSHSSRTAASTSATSLSGSVALSTPMGAPKRTTSPRGGTSP